MSAWWLLLIVPAFAGVVICGAFVALSVIGRLMRLVFSKGFWGE